jgi:hypothetical protein
VGFFTSGKLKKIPIEGGSVVTICDEQNRRGGSWGQDGTIVSQPSNVADTLLHRVPSGGGTPPPSAREGNWLGAGHRCCLGQGRDLQRQQRDDLLGLWIGLQMDDGSRTPRSNREVLWVRSFPNGEGMWKVSNSPGGMNPRWSPKRAELFYAEPASGRMMVMSLPFESNGATFRAGPSAPVVP